MKFNKDVIMFNIKNVNVIGNFENGGLIGLIEEGKKLCEKIEAGVISEEQAIKENKELFLAMKEMQYFETNDGKQVLFSTYLHVTQRCNFNCLYGTHSLQLTASKRAY